MRTAPPSPQSSTIQDMEKMTPEQRYKNIMAEKNKHMQCLFFAVLWRRQSLSVVC